MRWSDLYEYFALRRHLNHAWQFLRTRKKRLEQEFIDVPLKQGSSIRLRSAPTDRQILHRIFARDEYRLNAIPPDAWDTVIDVGAHIGLFALRSALIARRILCYEPARDNYSVLQHNLAHPDYSHIRAFPLAVSGRPGLHTLHLSENPAAHSVLSRNAPGAHVEVSALTLENIFSAHEIQKCDLLKLDCEGSEYEILGAVSDHLWARIQRIHMEYHPRPAGEGDIGQLVLLLENHGHKCQVAPSRSKRGRGHLFSVLK
jgi:FkbM family methyltransferase